MLLFSFFAVSLISISTVSAVDVMVAEDKSVAILISPSQRFYWLSLSKSDVAYQLVQLPRPGPRISIDIPLTTSHFEKEPSMTLTFDKYSLTGNLKSLITGKEIKLEPNDGMVDTRRVLTIVEPIANSPYEVLAYSTRKPNIVYGVDQFHRLFRHKFFENVELPSVEQVRTLVTHEKESRMIHVDEFGSIMGTFLYAKDAFSVSLRLDGEDLDRLPNSPNPHLIESFLMELERDKERLRSRVPTVDEQEVNNTGRRGHSDEYISDDDSESDFTGSSGRLTENSSQFTQSTSALTEYSRGLSDFTDVPPSVDSNGVADDIISSASEVPKGDSRKYLWELDKSRRIFKALKVILKSPSPFGG